MCSTSSSGLLPRSKNSFLASCRRHVWNFQRQQGLSHPDSSMKLLYLFLLLFSRIPSAVSQSSTCSKLKQTISDQRQSETSKKQARTAFPASNCGHPGIAAMAERLAQGLHLKSRGDRSMRPGALSTSTHTEEDEKHGDDQPESWQGQLVLAVAALVPAVAIAHGDVTPQAVDVSTLKPVGDDWLATNPYRGNAEAVRIGSSAYNQNCARCHGLEAISAASPRSALPPGRG